MKSVITGFPNWHPYCFVSAERAYTFIDFEKEYEKMDNAKIYGICLERLKHQITLARQRAGAGDSGDDPVILECYNTGEIEEIVDILEIYDIEEQTYEHLMGKLQELAFTISELSREALTFGYTEKGELGLYLFINKTSGVSIQEEIDARAAAVLA